MFDEIHALKPFKAAVDLFAKKEDWPPLYDVATLKTKKVGSPGTSTKRGCRCWSFSFSASAESPCFEPTPQPQTIIHCLLRHLLQVITKLEGPAVSQYCALRLLQATLDESLYDLA